MIDFDITVPPPAASQIILSEREEARRYHTKIIMGSNIYYQKYNSPARLIVLSATMAEILIMTPSWTQSSVTYKTVNIYHLVEYGIFQTLEVFIDFSTTGYIAKYFSSHDEVRNHYKGHRRADILKDLLN